MSAVPAPAAACHNHPGREALGVCVSCRQRVCGECVTKVDGINYCVSCYETLAPAKAPSAAMARLARVGTAIEAVVLFVVLSLLTWGLLAVGLPGG